MTNAWVKVLVIALCTMCLSCTSHRELVRRDLLRANAGFVGLHSDELLKVKGSPDFKESLSNGEEVWTYRSTKSGTSRGASIRIGGDDSKWHDTQTVAWTESVVFIIRSDKIIRSMRVYIE